MFVKAVIGLEAFFFFPAEPCFHHLRHQREAALTTRVLVLLNAFGEHLRRGVWLFPLL